MSDSEDEIRKREDAILEALTGLDVRVIAGPILKDEQSRPLTRAGAQTVLDRLRARGFRIERA